MGSASLKEISVAAAIASRFFMPVAMLAGTESRSSLANSFSNSSLNSDVPGSSEMECRSASTSDERCEEKVVEEVGDLLLEFSYFGAGVALALSADLEVASSMGTNEVVEQVGADLSMGGRLGARSWRLPRRGLCSAVAQSRSAGTLASGWGMQSMWA